MGASKTVVPTTRKRKLPRQSVNTGPSKKISTKKSTPAVNPVSSARNVITNSVPGGSNSNRNATTPIPVEN